MRELLEQDWGIAGIAAISGIGVLVRLLLLGYYGMLGRACGKFRTTKNRTIAYIREDLEKRAGGGQEIKNVLTYTEYRLAERRVCGFRIGSLETAVQYSILLTGVGGILVSMAGLLKGNDYKTVLFIFLFGGMSVAGLMILDLVSGLWERNKRVRLKLRDYIENIWEVSGTGALGEEEAASGLLQKRVSRTERREERKAERQKKKERKAGQKEGEKETREAKKSVSADKPKKAGKKKNGKAQEEKRRLTEELLRERRQLEARNLAEQRRMERKGSSEEQVQEEVAVAKCAEEQVPAEVVAPECRKDDAKSKTRLSYEALLDEFFKEYPA